MTKNGFTLAEVLVTLGIIGVIAALTMPNFINDSEKSKIGPKLAKAVAVFEQANQVLLQENSVDKITDIVYENKKEYVDNLSIYIKSSHVSDLTLTTKDNISYDFTTNTMGTSVTANQERFDPVWIRLKPDANKIGYDMFRFEFVTDGSLIPYGGTGFDGEDTSKPNGTDHWTTKCPADKKPSGPAYCAGHIFENNLKVLYK